MTEGEIITVFIGPTFALAGAFGGAFLNSFLESKRENDRWEKERQSSLERDLRVAIQTLATKLGAAVHSMSLLTWLAVKNPKKLNQKNIDQYDDELHELLAQIIGLKSVIIALDPGIAAQISGIVSKVAEMDEKIGVAGLNLEETDIESTKDLANLYKFVYMLEENISKECGEALGTTMMQRNRRGRPR